MRVRDRAGDHIVWIHVDASRRHILAENYMVFSIDTCNVRGVITKLGAAAGNFTYTMISSRILYCARGHRQLTSATGVTHIQGAGAGPLAGIGATGEGHAWSGAISVVHGRQGIIHH
jgi:hypothetical protein